MRFFGRFFCALPSQLVCVIKHEAKKRRTAKWTDALTITYFTLCKLQATVGRLDGCGNLITLPFNEATLATNKSKQLMSRDTGCCQGICFIIYRIGEAKGSSELFFLRPRDS